MTKREIFELPIQSICAEKSILFLWVTFPRLEQGFETIKAWGFEYYGLGFDWVKTTKGGTPCWGMGYYTRQNTEVCLIGVKRDKTKRIKPLSRGVLSVLHSERREHSRKPDECRKKIVEICGDIPRIELFARQYADGWDCWGNEITSDDEEYLDYNGTYLCEDCLEEFTLKGEDYQEAEAIYEEDYYGEII